VPPRLPAPCRLDDIQYSIVAGQARIASAAPGITLTKVGNAVAVTAMFLFNIFCIQVIAMPVTMLSHQLDHGEHAHAAAN
jgi:hypothetical protein